MKETPTPRKITRLLIIRSLRKVIMMAVWLKWKVGSCPRCGVRLIRCLKWQSMMSSKITMRLSIWSIFLVSGLTRWRSSMLSCTRKVIPIGSLFARVLRMARSWGREKWLLSLLMRELSRSGLLSYSGSWSLCWFSVSSISWFSWSTLRKPRRNWLRSLMYEWWSRSYSHSSAGQVSSSYSSPQAQTT